MKRFVIVIIALLSMIISYAVPYTVTANVLNLRTAPSTSAPVGKTAVKGENINVVSVEGDWATVEIAGKKYYGAVKYLTPATVASDKPESLEGIVAAKFTANMPHLSVPESWRYHSDIPFYVAVVLLFGFALICFFGDNDVYFDNEKLFYGGSIAFMCLCILELAHFFCYSGDPTWFCSGRVGLVLAIVDFILFGLFCYIQVMTFIQLTTACNYHGNRNCNNQIGYILTGLAIIFYLASCLFFPTHSNTVLILDLVTLAGWFMWACVCNSQSNGSWPNLLLFIAMWIIGMAGVLIMLMNFALILFIVLIGVMTWYIFFRREKYEVRQKNFFNIFED